MKVTIDSRLSGPDLDRILALDNVDVRRAYVSGFGGKIELFQFNSPQGKPFPEDFRVCDVGLTHIAFEVENIQELYRELSAKGVRFHSAPLSVKNRGMVCYLRDPDGGGLRILRTFHAGDIRRLRSAPDNRAGGTGCQ